MRGVPAAAICRATAAVIAAALAGGGTGAVTGEALAPRPGAAGLRPAPVARIVIAGFVGKYRA